MARTAGTLSLSSNIEGKFAAPLDARTKVNTLADLTAPGSFPYPYVGLWCYVVSEQKWYTLRYEDPTNIDNWVEGTTGKDGLDGKPIMVENTEKVGRENIITLVWTDIHGADHSTEVTILDGAAGPQGSEGPQGPAGQAFSLHSQYDTYEELIAEHPTGSEGEAYFVTSETPGAAPDVYVWLVDSSEWFNQGPITGIAGPRGADGVSPDVVVAENSEGVYKLRITTSTGSFVTPNLRGLDGNLAPQDKIDTSANPVQSGTLKTEFDKKQDKTLVSSVGVRDYETNNIVNQTTVQSTLEALAAAVNYMNIPAQLIPQVATESDLPANAKPGSICFVGEEGDTPIVYICQDDETWQKAGGASDDVMVEFTDEEIDNIWENGSDITVLLPVGWNEQTTFHPIYIWSDGDNTYYSEDNIQKVLNKSNHTWEDKTWNNVPVKYGTSQADLDGMYIWTDGDNIYYSEGSIQKVLNKSTSTWEDKTWNNNSSFQGSNIWSDGEQIYISTETNQKVLNKETSTWENKTWNGQRYLNGGYIWTDGDNIYYSKDTKQFVLNKSTSTWENKTWDEISNLDKFKIWKDGENIYYSDASIQKVLNKTTNQWEDKVWNNLPIGMTGTYIWTDGINIYYGDKGVLNRKTSTWETGGE